MIRPVSAAELKHDAFGSLRSAMGRDECIARGLERDGQVIAIGVIDTGGRATMPNDPALRLAVDAQQSATDEEMIELLRDLLAAAESLGASRLSAAWDPMDIRGLKRLEAVGFRSTGSLPYFEFAGGHVEYVTGYQDATGSTMDLVVELRR